MKKYQYISKAQRRASELSERTNRALKLNYMVVRNGKLVEVYPDGTSKVLRDAAFDTIRIDANQYTLVDE